MEPDPDFFADPIAVPADDGLFTAVPVLIALVAAVVVVVVLVRLVRAGTTFVSNSASPEQSVSARVVARRTQTEGGAGDTSVQTLYFATFGLPHGERVELKVPPREYGQLVEGDEGQLTSQGTWFRRFERRRVIPVDGTWEAPGGPSLPPPTTP